MFYEALMAVIVKHGNILVDNIFPPAHNASTVVASLVASFVSVDNLFKGSEKRRLSA